MYYDISWITIIQSEYVFKKSRWMSSFGQWNVKTKTTWEHGPTHKGNNALCYATPRLWHSQVKRSSLPPRNRHCRTFVTSSNCILGRKPFTPKKTPLKTNMTMEKQPFGDVSVSPIKDAYVQRGSHRIIPTKNKDIDNICWMNYFMTLDAWEFKVTPPMPPPPPKK